ncbi:OmpA family protein [Paractinoplanes hotanensis]|uniref:OmpA family protein n=1 Tax=Paractinoplanes hotanensis TaxID=2906497 RepID=A0ABT0Y4V2_9ACTN|nr:OmpA family protein [Actinoplanes hotanensis]MCM4081074.1 OmpA family protein [Actinoplanes hotanensis]
MNGRTRAGLVVLLTSALATGGCDLGFFLGEDDPQAVDRCTELLKKPVQASKPGSVTVLLADGSASAFTRPEPTRRGDWGAELGEHLPANGGDLVAIGLFGGAVDWRTEVITPAKSRDPQRTKIDFDDTRKCLTDDMSEAMKATPSKPQSDVLRALAEGADYVRKWPGPKSIYLATDGLSNTGCADLRAASIGDPSDLDKVVKACAPELPKLDKSFTVKFLGVGNSSAGWTDIKTPQRTWIASLWQRLCEATQATCPAPDSAKPEIMEVDGAETSADNDVPMPTITVVKDNPVTVTVPASLLFDVDKWVLADRAQDALQDVYANLGQLRAKRIEVRGHTDSTGTPEHNRKLSRQRAETIADKLRARDFGNVTTKGYASDSPRCQPEYRNGQPDRVAMACNRRVEILVYT